MNHWCTSTTRILKMLMLFGLLAAALPLSAQTTAAAAPAEATIEQRVADLEAYMNNVARPSGDVSKIAVPGPGHNAWLMTS